MASDSAAQYGYEAGWMDAREMVYAAMECKHNSTTMAALRALWESMGAEARKEKSEAYVRELGKP